MWQCSIAASADTCSVYSCGGGERVLLRNRALASPSPRSPRIQANRHKSRCKQQGTYTLTQTVIIASTSLPDLKLRCSSICAFNQSLCIAGAGEVQHGVMFVTSPVGRGRERV
ncbi:hypothetical protein Zmor_002932 [Zophobas morio]|uniref:Uncharacterized protein n=1 Tax=Zophobas morio TaxID=2755281 RepID=A0AA38HM11_9CUCU|nr:hypothetical protein Zmor_002932 [Zophobas morio]